MLKRNLLLMLRRVKSREKFMWLNILSFTVGLCAFMYITLFVYNEMTVDTCYPHHNRTYRVLESDNDAGIDYHLNDILSNDYPEIVEAVPVYQSSEYEFELKTSSQRFVTKSFISTDNDFFRIFDIKTINAGSENILPTENSVALTPSAAQILFGNEEALGQKVDFLGKMLTVSAIIPEFSLRSSFHADFIVNIRNEDFRFLRGRKNETIVNLHNHYVVVDEGVNPEALFEKINRNLPSRLPTVGKVSLQPLRAIYLNPEIEHSRNRHGNKTTLKVLISIAGVILLLSVINNLQFTVSYHFSNIKSIGLQLFNGANKRQIFLHYLFDTSVLFLLVYLISLLLLWAFLPIVNPVFSGGIALSHILSWPFLALMSLTFVLIIILGGYVPIYVLAKTDIKNLLSKKVLPHYRPTFKSILPIFQFVITIVLLTGAVTIQKQLAYTKSHDLGFDKQHLLQLIDPSGFDKNNALKQKMENLSFVKSASWSYGAPAFITAYYYTKEGEEIYAIGIDDNFLKTFGISLIEGRNFQAGDLEKVCYVNEAYLKSKDWRNTDDYANQKVMDYKIIGVVKDFSSSSLHESIGPTVLYYTNSTFFLNLRLSKGNLPEQMSEIKTVWKEVYPDEFFNYKFYDDVFDSMYKKEEKMGQAINLFTIIAFFITGMGLLGLVMQISISYTKEIGIRKVNGAKVWEVMALLNKDFVKWVAIAFAIATPVAWYAMNQWLENFAYKTELSWWIFALAGVLALGIALLTVSWQSWKAATRNPVEALRYE